MLTRHVWRVVAIDDQRENATISKSLEKANADAKKFALVAAVAVAAIVLIVGIISHNASTDTANTLDSAVESFSEDSIYSENYETDCSGYRMLSESGSVSLRMPQAWDAFLVVRDDGVLAYRITSDYENVFMESWISPRDMEFILYLETSTGALVEDFIFADGGIGHVLRIEDYHFREVLFLNESDGVVLVYVVATPGSDDWIDENLELIYRVASTLTLPSAE